MIPPLDDSLAAAYLERLRVDAVPCGVDAQTLAALQRTHLAGVQGRGAEQPLGPNGNHFGLTVRVKSGDGTCDWLVDAGHGDGPPGPLPLVSGTYEQEGFVCGLGPSPLAPGGWRLDYDPRGAWYLVDVAPEPATTADFAAMHVKLSTSPDSGFVRVATVQRRTGMCLEVLRGCVFTERESASVRERDVDSPDEWWGLVLDRLGLEYGDLTASDREDLWRRVRATHEARDAAGRP